MNELITVVVPVYNVENYINKCIDSILDQTYKNLEIILVDDGSEDNSGIICDEYKKKNSNITVIHKVNGGLSDARNAGINIAHGKYIAFIDSDDFIDNRMIEVLYNALKKNNADISICGIQIVKNLKREIKKSEKKGYIETVNQYQAYKNLYNNKAMETVVAWNKLYKIDLFKNIRYPIGKINEDAFVIHHLISKTNKIVYVSDKLYYYIKRKNSIMGKKFNQKRLDVLEAYEDRMKFFKDNNMNELYEKNLYRYCAENRYCYINIDNIKIKNELEKKFTNAIDELKYSKYISKKEKIKIFILKNFIILYKINILLKG